MSSPQFDSAWIESPKIIRRVTERECAEYYYRIGQRDKQSEMLATQNADMKEMQRLATLKTQDWTAVEPRTAAGREYRDRKEVE